MSGGRVGTATLAALQGDSAHIRNICIIAHVDHGKTTLSDSLVSSNGIISDRLAGKIRYLDNTEEEQLRGITMKSSAISLLYEGPVTPAEKAVLGEDATVPYLINLVDSPGHVDFSFDVSTAVRLCDGALVLIDVIEGVCAQTHAVLRQAWQEGIRPCLVLNKIDRLIYELQFTPLEAYQHICRIVEQANVIISSMIRADILEEQNEVDASELLDDDGDETESRERRWMFSPARGNVLFASAYDGWAFGIGYFAAYYAKKFDMPQGPWRLGLWGDNYFHAKTKKMRATPWTAASQPMFVAFVLEPLWAVYKAMEEPTEHNPDALGPLRQLTKNLRVAKVVSDRELLQKDRRLALQCVMRKWLPLATAVLKMVTRMLPSPVTAQKMRAERLCLPDSSVPGQLATFNAIQACAVSDDAPVVVYICKMLSVEATNLSDYALNAELRAAYPIKDDNRGAEVYVAVARVFAGTFRPDRPIHVLGPKYTGGGLGSGHVTTMAAGSLGLYMVMGSEFIRVDSVAAGNIVGIVGLHEQVLKTATLSTTLDCPSLARMPYQAKPIVRVAVEPEDPRNFAELEAGLQRLYRSDPTVEVHVQETGEHVIVALGELHLERCVKDLKERFAKVPLHVSEPLVGFRETIVGGEASGTALLSTIFKDLKLADMSTGVSSDGKHKTLVCPTPDGQVAVHLRAVSLPAAIVEFLEAHADDWKRFHATDDDPLQASVRAELSAVLAACDDDFWRLLDVNRLWSCGPRKVGPNVLVNNVADFVAPSNLFHLNRAIVTDERQKLESSLVSGFQLATACGPLCDEPVWGVAFVVEDLVVTPLDADAQATSAYGPLSGQVISTMKSGCRSAFLHQPVRLVEAMYKCSVQCQSEQLGKLYSVFARRRARVVSEELTDGSALFSVEAYLPVVESFGFATELLKSTSGNASNPQLLFDHWATMDEDPFFQPTTEEEREDFGETIAEHNAVRKLIEGVRKRKGLAREEKIVVHAEKQRTLGRNK
ncbi:elongation factor G [Achlya hypogyna]|uniref:Ribosome assembly protein 1 n=1 Tax=Achlya hypogyna TaxID=1202772 RepID=A0A1V9YD84_ACHHY|nr:elongation factor G [Achlya hypogyna]